jgi:hypothetical protein
MLDKNDIAIFKGVECIYTSNGVDRSVIESIITQINYLHRTQINNVVNLFGIIYWKNDIERMLGVKWEDFQVSLNKILEMSGGKEQNLDNDNHDEEDVFEIDDILDKIGRFGMNSLTIEERKFLDDYSRY